jgi:hypothetical protein
LPTLEFGHISKGKLTEHQTQRRNGSTFHQSNRDNNKTLHKPQRQKLTPIYTIDNLFQTNDDFENPNYLKLVQIQENKQPKSCQ